MLCATWLEVGALFKLARFHFSSLLTTSLRDAVRATSEVETIAGIEKFTLPAKRFLWDYAIENRLDGEYFKHIEIKLALTLQIFRTTKVERSPQPD